MTRRRYTFAATLCWGGDVQTGEAEVECSYAVAWGRPATGPSCVSGGEPADPDEIEDVCIITVDGRPWPVDLTGGGYMSAADQHDMLTEKLVDENWDAMLDAAAEQDGR